jgi:PEP-CTERM/exosortase A-associated glycosyltransferase
MRILHVFDHSLPLQSGYVYRSLGILGAQRGLGWETIQLTTPRNNPGPPGEEVVDGWTFHRTARPSWPLSDRPVLRELAEIGATERRIGQLIARFRPDIVHAHSPVLTAIPARRAARRAGVKMVYEIRGSWEDAAADHGTLREGDLRYRAMRALETRAMRRADAVVTLCAAMRAEIMRRGVPEARITVVPNAVDPARFRPAGTPDPALQAELGLEGRTVLGFIGSFYHYEGLDLLLRAMPLMLARLPDLALLLVGGGEQEQALRRLAESLSLQGAVRFTGRVPHGEVGRYYDLVDALVFPRRRMRLTELVTPLKPLEAMAEGRLVMASDVGGHRELIADGGNGILFPPDDPGALAERVVATLADRSAHERLRAEGRRFVAAERTWPIAAARYEPLYRRLLEGTGPAGAYPSAERTASP